MNNTIVSLPNGDFYVEYPKSIIQKYKRRIKYLFLLLFIFGLMSCDNKPDGEEIVIENNNKPSLDYRVVVIDGHEYIEFYRDRGRSSLYSITHKADCKNHELDDWK